MELILLELTFIDLEVQLFLKLGLLDHILAIPIQNLGLVLFF